MTEINLKPYQMVFEGSHNGNSFELNVFRDNQQWELYWYDIPEDYPGSHLKRMEYDEKIYMEYKRMIRATTTTPSLPALEDIKID